MSKKEREICEFQIDLNKFFCLRSNLSSDTERRARRREPWERGWRKCLSPSLSTGHDPWSQQMQVIQGT